MPIVRKCLHLIKKEAENSENNVSIWNCWQKDKQQEKDVYSQNVVHISKTRMCCILGIIMLFNRFFTLDSLPAFQPSHVQRISAVALNTMSHVESIFIVYSCSFIEYMP